MYCTSRDKRKEFFSSCLLDSLCDAENLLVKYLFSYLGLFYKANYRYNYIVGNDHSFFYFNYPDLSPVYDK